VKPRGKAVLWALWPVLLLAPLLLWLGRSFAHQLAYEQRIRTQHALELDADAVQRSFDQIIAKLKSLAAFVADQTAGGKAIDEEKFNTFAAGLHASAKWIRAFQIVSNGNITHVYPLQGNEAVLGYNLLRDPRPVIGGDVIRARQTGRVTITGPLDLVQGGLGIIIRQPLPQAEGAPARLVAIVLNIAPLLAESGIREGDRSDARLAIRGASGDAFWGSPSVFADRPVTRRLLLPDVSWEMGACPAQGWSAFASRPVLLFYAAGTIIVFLLCLLVFVLARSRANLEETVRDRTIALRHELAARQQAQEQLQQNYSLLQAVTEGTSDAVFVKDRQGRYQMINSAGAGFLGRAPETILGKDDTELFSADSAAAIMEGDRKVIESGLVKTFEERATTAGITRVQQATKAPWRDPHGHIIGVVGVSRDITERKRMEEAIRENERQLSLILNNVSDVIFAIAVEPNNGFRFISANRRFLEATGLSEGQIVGARVQDVIPEPAQALVFAQYHEAIRSGRSVRWEEASDYPAGRKIGHVTVVPVLDARGVCTQLVGMVHDVTERNQAEEQIRKLNEDLRRHAEVLERRVAERTAELVVAKERAEAADRVKSAFLAAMSHELRTPLNSVIGFTGLLLQGLAGELNVEQSKQLRWVKESGQHLLELINDVLDISKIEAGQIEIRSTTYDLTESIQKVVQTVSPLAAKKQLQLVVSVTPEVGRITSDRRRVEQILLNLVGNAIKFTERGEVRVDCRVDQRYVVTRVTDTGPGIKPEDLGKLFQPFRQLDTDLTRQHEGTGLGLAICKRLLERLGGEIRIESEWGQGSAFIFTLPIQPETKS
jgi:PAS domain S-box-containing protein